MRPGRTLLALLLLLLAPVSLLVAQATGRISGRVIDKGEGRPVATARVRIGTLPAVETDLDGRFRSGELAPGRYSVTVAAIGYQPVRLDSVVVTAGQVTPVTIAITANPVQLADLEVTSEAAAKVSNDAGLLAAQQSAAVVLDGVSAQAILRTPDSDASAAVRRVTGVTVLGDKVVVRGLGERYSTSLLNGVEVASPDPDSKFVPLDVFSAKLLENIVAYKTASPDRPGDFSGGTVDIQTKEFPDEFTASLEGKAVYQSRSTFNSFAAPPRSGLDFLGFDGKGRGIPEPTGDAERWAESFNPVWQPPEETAAPGMEFSGSLGNRHDVGQNALGYVISGRYATGRVQNPDRIGYGSSEFLYDENRQGVDLSGIVNLAYRIGTGTKFGLKNFYSRESAEEVRLALAAGNSDLGDATATTYQMRYLQRYVAQTQLTGDHLLGLLGSRVEWKGTLGWAGRDDLDNRQLTYVNYETGPQLNDRRPNFRTNTRLTDRLWSGQADWSIPLSLRSTQDAVVKVGALYRSKDRTYEGSRLAVDFSRVTDPQIRSLPPERLLAGENIGGSGILYQPLSSVNPYTGTEVVAAGYGLVDLDVLSRLRLSGGVRYEDWQSTIDIRALGDTAGEPVRKAAGEWLPSVNLTWRANDQVNVRLAGYRTVVRPDQREFAPGGYEEVAGEYPVVGNPDLEPGSVWNGDFRIEAYPAAQELLAFSVYYKSFTNPIVMTTVYAGLVESRPVNAASAKSYGIELEARKGLGFLGAPSLQLGANLSLVGSDIVMAETFGIYEEGLDFQGLSPYIVNLSATWAPSKPALTASLAFNRFGQRIVRYGTQVGDSPTVNEIEEARSAVDAKVKLGLWPGLFVSLSGTNLSNAATMIREDDADFLDRPPAVIGRSVPGYTVSFAVSYEF